MSARGAWAAQGGPADSVTSGSVALGAGSCIPGNPGATLSETCAKGGAEVVFTNTTGGGTVTFTVKKNQNVIDTVNVGPNGSTTKVYPMAEDEERDVHDHRDWDA